MSEKEYLLKKIISEMTSKKKLKRKIRELAHIVVALDDDAASVIMKLRGKQKALEDRIDKLEQLTEREAEWCAQHVHSAAIAFMSDAATHPELPWTEDDLAEKCKAPCGSVQGLMYCTLTKDHSGDHEYELPKPKKRRVRAGYGDPCSECGMSDHECFRRIIDEHKAACCSTCSYTDTHNYDRHSGD